LKSAGTGQNFFIRIATPGDASLICEPRNKGDRLYLKDPNLYSVDDTYKWLTNLPSSSKRFIVEEKCDLTVFGYVLPTDAMIGVIRIDNIDRNNSCCEIGLDIWDKHKGKGLAIPIYRWLLNHLFNELNFHSVYLEVIETNERARHIYEKLGFRLDGRLRDRIFRDGRYWDYLYMSLRRSEYKNE
jgi:RimJ/RimL family protein N-acetyltransferase